MSRRASNRARRDALWARRQDTWAAPGEGFVASLVFGLWDRLRVPVVPAGVAEAPPEVTPPVEVPVEARDGAWVDARVAELSEALRTWTDPEPAPRAEDLAWIHRLARLVTDAPGRRPRHPGCVKRLPGPHIYLQEDGGVSAEWDGPPAVTVVRRSNGEIKLITSWWLSRANEPRKMAWTNSVLSGDLTQEQVFALILSVVDLSQTRTTGPT